MAETTAPLLILSQLTHLNFRREILYLTRAMAEACMLAPWLAAWNPLAHRPALLSITSSVFFIILGASYLARSMEALKLKASFRYVVAAGALLVLIIWALDMLAFIPHHWLGWQNFALSLFRSLFGLSNIIPPSLLVILVAIFLWWRGLQLAQKAFSVLDVIIGFRVGILVFALFLLFSPRLVQQVNPFIMAYFFCQLLAIGLTRVETIGDQLGGRRSPFGAWWVIMLALSTSVVILVAGVVYGIVAGIGPENILNIIAPVLGILLLPFIVLIGPLLALAMLLIEPLIKALVTLSDILQNMMAGLQQLINLSNSGQPAQRPVIVEIALQALGVSKGIVVLGITALIIIGVIWAISRSRAQSQVADEEERETVWSAGRWLARLRKRLGQRLKQITNARDILAQFGLEGLFTAITIRRIYAQLQHLAAKRGYPRAPACTPYEYLSALNECFPNCASELSRITQAYVGIRYGELPEHPQELEEIRAAWNHIRASEPQKSPAN